eukprot:TRINITY_DN6804_c0_g1_i8.p1 TRINITY_DN6804_c0_g1~~TRINITY_DN6804_c0_g1_i8.p1  ORF type:complete len:420 (-),score=78.12 TRINITY_DN6804_c0_g1_i8:34-1293(-)
MNIIREIVSGRKNRFKKGNYNLDLTYVCPRVIAMSYPASGFESAYRNNIDEVSKFIKDRHSTNYRIYNLSGRKYNYDKFEKNSILDYLWKDHHSPPIDMLFDICQNIDEFLKGDANRCVIVHCLAGKGRTGTMICCYLLWSGRFKTSAEALTYYSKKRFSKGEGVTQPSQKRYVEYFERILNEWKRNGTKLYSVMRTLKEIRLNGVPDVSTSGGCRPYIEIYNVATDEKLYTNKEAHGRQRKYQRSEREISIPYDPNTLLVGDILIKLKNNGKISDELLCRWAFNTTFVDDTVHFNIDELDPDSTKKDSRFPETFSLETIFEKKSEEKDYFSDPKVQKEQETWNRIYAILATYKQPTFDESQVLLFGDPDFDDVDEYINASEDTHPDAGDELLLQRKICLLYTSPSPRDGLLSRMPSSA